MSDRHSNNHSHSHTKNSRTSNRRKSNASTEKAAAGEREIVDVVVVGGGMVGSATALGLAQYGLRVVLLESNKPRDFNPSDAPDLRVSAINLASVQLLEELGAWSILESMRVHPYQRLSVWEHTGRCDFSASELNLDKLGYFVENRLLQLALHQKAREFDNLDIIYHADITQVTWQQSCSIDLSSGAKFSSSWIIAADGVHSSMREQAGINTQGWKYSQEVLATLVTLKNGTQDITWQQFSSSGPMAFLPLYQGYAALIWYNDASEVARLKALSSEQLKLEIRHAFPPELDEFEVVSAASFPVQRMHATQYSKDDLLLIGDAAHSINPLAGQGVNLGFKDVAALLRLLDKNGAPNTVAAKKKLFKQYERKRRYDNLMMMSAMDALYVGFSNDVAPLKTVRNIGFSVASALTPLKLKVLKYAAGVV